MIHRIFVYGTLKRGHSNSALLEGSEFLGEAATVLTYKAVTHPAYSTVGTSFPVIMRDPRGKAVVGEIYTVDDATLARLDNLERDGRSYDRLMIEVSLPRSTEGPLTTQAFIYVGREDRFGEMFARDPSYEEVNERGELDWRAC